MSLPVVGKSLVILGALLAAVGLVLMFSPKIPLLGKLPGDLHFKRDNFEIILPLATSLLLSVVLSGILWLIQWWNSKL